QKLVQRNASKLAKRVSGCLDVRTNDKGDLVVTKGDQYDVRERTNANEFSFLNNTAFREFPLGDQPMLQVLRYASGNVFVPLTVGGGIRDFTDGNGRYYSSLEVASEYFRPGAAEEYLKSGVKTGKSSLEQISQVYGNQAVVVSIDPRWVYVKDLKAVEFKTMKVQMEKNMHGISARWAATLLSVGEKAVRPIGAYEFAKAVVELGAGEILLNCIDCDGVVAFLTSCQGKGFDIDLIKLISDAVSIPVIASGVTGAVEHFTEVFRETNASAAHAARISDRKEVS
ncbi:Imidazole glycerol phosphate synthase hisHF, chloroplastic, partial [Capsicum chinense]